MSLPTGLAGSSCCGCSPADCPREPQAQRLSRSAVHSRSGVGPDQRERGCPFHHHTFWVYVQASRQRWRRKNLGNSSAAITATGITMAATIMTFRLAGPASVPKKTAVKAHPAASAPCQISRDTCPSYGGRSAPHACSIESAATALAPDAQAGISADTPHVQRPRPARLEGSSPSGRCWCLLVITPAGAARSGCDARGP